MVNMTEHDEVCPACGSQNQPGAATCASCGAEISANLGSNGFSDNDPALEHVDPEHRVELERYETDTGAEAEIDCGLLRANGIACELGAQTIPGLPANMILWVDRKDAEEARALLDDVETPGPEDEVA
jgi:hypothetical protein